MRIRGPALLALIVAGLLFSFTHSPPEARGEITTSWQAQYYANATLSGAPALTRTDAAIDFDWGQGSPGPGVPNELFSARWTGQITVTAGSYRFETSTDDGVRLYVDGNLVIDGWIDQLTTTYTVDVPLTAGAHTVVMEYYESYWVGVARLSIEATPIAIGLGANEPGLRLLVDGVEYTTPALVPAEPGVTHTVYAPSPQTTDDGRTVTFAGWSDGGLQQHDITPTANTSLQATFATAPVTPPVFQNGFEEGDLSQYVNVDVSPGNSIAVTQTNPRTGAYSLEVSTGGATMPAVVDKLFPNMNTIYQRSFISLPPDFELQPGAVQNLVVLKTNDFRNALWVTMGPDYRLSPVFFDSAGASQFPGPFGPEIPRDGLWHEVQVRYTVDAVHGQVEMWIDGERVAWFTDVDTGLAGRDDVGVVSWGSYFSTVTNTTTAFFDDVVISPTFVTSEGFQTDVIADGLFIPTFAAFAPDGRIFIALKDGTIQVVKNGVLLPEPVVTIPNVNTYQDRGLISIALDPDFATNGYLYATYTHDVDPGDFTGPKTARLVRLTVAGDQADLGSMEVLLGTVVGDAASPSCDDFPMGTDCVPSDARTHTIGQVFFLPDGTLVVSTGEGAPDINVNTQALRSQNLDSLAGKILRINPDGTAPADNPFFTGDPAANRSKVWAYGFRNPFRFTMRPSTGTLYVGDVGWGTWEEIDVVHAGQNYGWPCFEAEEFLLGYSAYQLCQDLEAAAAGTVTPPLYYYPHPPSSAVVGGAFYQGTEYPSQYQGAFFFGDYARNSISILRANGLDELVPGSVNPLTNAADGPVQILTGPDGNIYYLSINTGQLRRITYVAGNRAPVPQASATPAAGLLPLQVQFSSEGTLDPEGHPMTYYWDFGDGATSDEANPQHTFTAARVYNVRLTAEDALGADASAIVQVVAGNAPPVATIATPTAVTQYSVGETITFSGGATDYEDGAMSPSTLSWQIILHHCEVITSTCHSHPFIQGTGASGSFVVPDHGGGVSFELVLTATDSTGLTDTASVEITPQLVPLTIESSPPGLTIAVDGSPRTTPATVNVVQNSEHTLFAPSPQTAAGATLQYYDWSDGGAQNHAVTAPGATTVRVHFRDGDDDTDNDGCSDARELASNETQGGQRDLYSFWDYFDTPNAANSRDRTITIADIVNVVARFGANGSSAIDPLSAAAAAPAYHTAFDRAAAGGGGDPWDAGAPDGVVSTIDLVLSVAQFGHSCA